MQAMLHPFLWMIPSRSFLTRAFRYFSLGRMACLKWNAGLATLVFRAAELHSSAPRPGFTNKKDHANLLPNEPGFMFPQSFAGVDLCSLDGKRAILCRADNATLQDVKRFLRTARCLAEAGQLPDVEVRRVPKYRKRQIPSHQ